jgi:hypothetical protein
MSVSWTRVPDTRNIPGGEGAGIPEMPAPLVTSDQAASRSQQPHIATVRSN